MDETRLSEKMKVIFKKNINCLVVSRFDKNHKGDVCGKACLGSETAIPVPPSDVVLLHLAYSYTALDVTFRNLSVSPLPRHSR